MNSSTSRAMTGALVLMTGAAAELTQYVIMPVHLANGDAADQVAAVAGHADRMQVSLWLDLPVLLMIPAVLVLGMLAGARTSRLAALGTTIAFVGTLTAGFLLGNDVLIYLASKATNPTAATDLLAAYESFAVVVLATTVTVLGTSIGLILLGVALLRSRIIPRWAAVVLIAAPVLSVFGEASGTTAMAICGHAAQLVAFAAAAYALKPTHRRGSAALATLTGATA